MSVLFTQDVPVAQVQEWRSTWRDHLAPSLTMEQLRSLATALASDDPRLVQGDCVRPSPFYYSDLDHDAPAQPGNQAPIAVCLLGWCAWSSGCATAAAVQDYVHRVQLGDHLDALVDWFDKTPRDKMRRDLLQEVQRSIAQVAA